MKLFAKPLLWLLTTAIPVFIAACYGSPGDGFGSDSGPDPETSITGRVLGALTGSGIPYIRVSCWIYENNGSTMYDETYTRPDDGSFELWSSEYTPCQVLHFEDVDGEDNGAYETLVIDYIDDGQDVVVELAEQH